MKTGVELIADERRRQIEVEGWTPQHDDQWTRFELSRAASCYLHASESALITRFWPFDWKWWKPSYDKISNLIKAGALIAAEIDRLQRKDEEIKP